MSGLKSKRKGYAAERGLVKELIAKGYVARRQPCSGSIRGFEGDVVVEVPGRPKAVIIEVKCRRDEFKRIYAMVEGPVDQCGGVIFNYEGIGILVTKEFSKCGFTATEFVPPVANPVSKEAIASLKKLHSLQKHLKSNNVMSDLLVIKIDYKPYLYIRYLV